MRHNRGSELNFFIKLTIVNLKYCGRKRIEWKKFEIHRILQNLLYQYLHHSWTLHLAKRVPRILVIQQTTQHWTQVTKIMNFTANVVAKFVFLPVMARSQHACYWLDSCSLQELLYCLMLWTILFYSFLFSWEFLSGLWLANLSVTSSIQSMHMQVILHNDDFLLKVTKLSSYVV